MIGFIRELRLIPIAVVACLCLLALKAADVMLGRSPGDAPADNVEASLVRASPDVPRQSTAMLSWASQMFNFPDGSGEAPPARPGAAADRRGDRADRGRADRGNGDITGSVGEQPAKPDKGDAKTGANTDAKAEPKTEPAKPAVPINPPAQPAGTLVPLGPGTLPSVAERAILERLQQRREELDTRARELDIRESLIKAAEKRMEGQLAELKETEARIKVETQQQDDAQAGQFKSLVTMYENMKPRDAAKIFDRLELGVLIEVASKINPRNMSEILAQMSPATAEKLTVELANKAQQVRPSASASDLPKIQGQPTSQ
jgi:flagellar motility protein MotE (MotC chaperone)